MVGVDESASTARVDPASVRARYSSADVLASVTRHVFEVARARGANVEQVIADAHLDTVSLGRARRVARAVDLAVWRAASLQDPEVGLAAATSPVVARALGTAGFLARASATAFDGLLAITEYYRLIYADISVSLRLLPDQVELNLVGGRVPLSRWPRAAVEFSALSILTLLRQAAGEPLNPVEVSLACRPASDASLARDFFACPIRHGQPRNALLFHRVDLTKPLQSGRLERANFLLGVAQRELMVCRSAQGL